MISVACIQMVSTDKLEENFRQAMSLLEEVSASSDCELVVFPENFLHFGLKPSQDLVELLKGYIERFCVVAKQRGVSLVLGTMPFPADDDRDRFYSRCIVINASGSIQAYYDKQHLFDVDVGDEHGSYRESDTYCPGVDTLVTSLPFSDGSELRIGVAICYDLRFPEQFVQMRLQGAQVIVVPAAFTEKTGRAHWELLLRARAIDTQCYIVAANQGGEHSAGRKAWGHSMIVDPWGKVMTELEKAQGAGYAQLDLSLLEQIRRAMPIRNA